MTAAPRCTQNPKLYERERIAIQTQESPNNFDVFIFFFFQRILSREPSAIYALPKNLTCCHPGLTTSEEIASKPQDSPSLGTIAEPAALNIMLSARMADEEN